MAQVNQDYYLKPGESQSDWWARQGYPQTQQSASPAPTPSPAASTGTGFTPEAQQGLDALQKSNPQLAQNIQQNSGLGQMSAPPQPFNIQTPATVPSTMLGQGATPTDAFNLRNQYEQFINQQKQYQEQILGLMAPSDNEKALTERANALANELRQYDFGSQQAQLDNKGRLTTMNAIVGEGQRLAEQQAMGRTSITNEYQAVTDQLKSLVDARSKSVDQITTMMQFSKGNMELLQSMQKLTMPEVLGTQVNDMTGDVFSIVRDPMTGQTSMQKIGNVGTGKQYLSQGVYQDGQGYQYFYGVRPDGTIENIKLGGAGKPLAGGNSDQLYSGLSTQTATAVRAKVSKFSTEAIVQNFQTIQEGYNFVTSLSDTTTNPADDQALIYSLAKALDPGSVVREGEYATAQKYAQSWISAYGKGVEQALAGTGFLSETARKNIKETIKSKYSASKKSYDQTVKSYTTSINSLTGRTNGQEFLIDYITPLTPPPQKLTAQNNFSYLLTPQYNQKAQQIDFNINEALAAGYTLDEITAFLDSQ